jgi:transcriptional regulator with XRE-family HTH domain
MHLISYGSNIGYRSLYHKAPSLTRVDTLPYIFRRLRTYHNLTKKSLAAKCGVSEEYVSAVESGSKYPSLKFCLQCGSEFGMNPNYVRVKWCNSRVSVYRDALLKRLKLND